MNKHLKIFAGNDFAPIPRPAGALAIGAAPAVGARVDSQHKADRLLSDFGF